MPFSFIDPRIKSGDDTLETGITIKEACNY